MVHLGGKRILHVGDVHYGAENFAPFDLELEGIDVVILPTFNTLLSAANASIIAERVAPRQVVALHFQASLLQAESLNATALYGARSFTKARSTSFGIDGRVQRSCAP